MKTETIEIVTTWRITYETLKGRERAVKDALAGLQSSTFSRDGMHTSKPTKKARILKP